ncbi:MAG: nucleotidyltransferase domain-containing protein [Promethearchaeota archaeon]
MIYNYIFIFYGSRVEGEFCPESNIDIGVFSRNRNQKYNRELQKNLLGQFHLKFYVRVFELLPIDIQMPIIQNNKRLESLLAYIFLYKNKYDFLLLKEKFSVSH